MNTRINQITGAMVLLLIATAATLTKGYKIGDTVTDFSLRGVDDKEVSLASFEDAKGYIVIFTCNHCPYAKLYEDRIIALNAKYKEKGYPVIAINPNDPELAPTDDMEHMKSRAMEKGFTFPYLMDETQNVYRSFGATRTPHVYVLEKTNEGSVVRYIGAVDDNYEDASEVKKKYVEEAVDALLAGKKVEITETKAIGCSIKDKMKK